MDNSVETIEELQAVRSKIRSSIIKGEGLIISTDSLFAYEPAEEVRRIIMMAIDDGLEKALEKRKQSSVNYKI